MKIFSKAVHFFTITIIGLLLLFSVILAALQTKWGQNKLREALCSALSTSGVYLQIDKIEGRLPFDIRLEGVKVQTPRGQEVYAPHVKIRLALFPLLRKEIAITYFYARRIEVLFSEKQKSIIPTSASLPFTLSFKSAKVPHLKFIKEGKTLDLSVSATGKLKKNLRELFFDLAINTKENKIKVQAFALKHIQNCKIEIKADIENLKEFETFYSFDFDAKGKMNATLEGPFDAWESLLHNQKGKTLPLEGHLSLHLNSFQSPFYTRAAPLDTDLTFFLFSDHSIQLSKAHLENDLIKIDGHALIKDLVNIESVDLSFSMPDIKPLLPIEGALTGSFHFDPLSANLDLKSTDIQIGTQAYTSFHASLKAISEDHEWKGHIESYAENPIAPLESKATFAFKPSISFTVSDIELTSSNNQIHGDLEYQFCPKALDGDLYVQIYKLEQFQDLFPRAPLKGMVGAKIHFFQESAQHSQAADINATFKNAHLMDISVKETVIDAHLFDLFGMPRGTVTIEGQNLLYSHLELLSFNLNTQWTNHAWPYSITIKGMGKDNFELTSKGYAQEGRLNIDEFSGFALKKPFNLEKPFQIEWGKDKLSLNDFDLKVGGGSLNFSLNYNPKKLVTQIKAEHLPLDILALYYPSFSLHGFSSFEGNLTVQDDESSGRLNLVLERAEITGLGRQQEVDAKGSLLAFLDKNRLQLYVHMQEKEGELLEAKASLPIHLDLPLKFKLDKNSDLAAELNVDGRLEDIFDFINLGSHRLKGMLKAHLHLSKTLSSPILGGEIELKEGSYENYYTATNLRQINAKIVAQKNELKLLEFTAADQNEGSLNATGVLHLDIAEKFPYHLESELKNLNSINFESISANFTGPLTITGNADQASAKGDLIIEKGEGEIPDSLPLDVPVLNITYLNKPVEEAEKLAPSPLFPFSLDIAITAPESTPGKIFVRGRGLRSEWKGTAHLKGTNAGLAAVGAFTLLRGEFVFSGKVFQLSEGEITLTDKPSQRAHINLKAVLTLPEITITALINGPVTSPMITFQSSPHMPTSAILAHILFNKDISEITPLQAVQLAQMIVTLSGKMGPDVLETIRRSLGVDRLNIVSSQDGSDEVAIQIGKYLTKGVMVTLSQGTDSTQVVVEAELSHGFVFQAETQPDQEGKFSLKWHKNY